MLADWDVAAAELAATAPADAASSAARSQFLAVVLQLAPAVFSVANKFSRERGVPAGSDPAGDDTGLLGYLGALIYFLVDPPSCAGKPHAHPLARIHLQHRPLTVAVYMYCMAQPC